MDMSGYVSLGITVLGIIGSLKFYQQRRALKQTIQRARLELPNSSDHTIGGFLRNRQNREYLDAFFIASKQLRLLIYAIQALAVVIIVVLMVFYLKLTGPKPSQIIQPADSRSTSQQIIWEPGHGRPAIAFDLPKGKWLLLKFDPNTGTMENVLPNGVAPSGTFLSIDEAGIARQTLVPELILGVLVFAFILLIVMGHWIINRMADFAEEIRQDRDPVT